MLRTIMVALAVAWAGCARAESEPNASQPPTPGVEVLIRSVSVEGAARRVLVAKPETAGRHPAVLIVGGLGCYPLDRVAPDQAPYPGLIYGLARAGYVVAEVEKTGQGGSGGPPCSSEAADFNLEIAGNVAGLKALESYPFVDPQRVFIFAHSLGPLEAVKVAQAEPVRGLVLAETIGRAWFDYELEIVRSQPLDLGLPYDQVERSVRYTEPCLHRYYVEKASAKDLLAGRAGCKAILVPGVPDSLLHEVADLDLAAEWKKLDAPVLVIYGTTDPATDAGESRYLVDMINSFHPGRASYLEIPGMGHTLSASASKGLFLREHGGPHPKLKPELLPAIERWLASRSRA